MKIFIQRHLVEHVKKEEKELNYILTKVGTNIDSNFNVRRLTVLLGSSTLKNIPDITWQYPVGCSEQFSLKIGLW